jgi:hypothetical protein
LVSYAFSKAVVQHRWGAAWLGVRGPTSAVAIQAGGEQPKWGSPGHVNSCPQEGQHITPFRRISELPLHESQMARSQHDVTRVMVSFQRPHLTHWCSLFAVS